MGEIFNANRSHAECLHGAILHVMPQPKHPAKTRKPQGHQDSASKAPNLAELQWPSYQQPSACVSDCSSSSFLRRE